MSKKVGALVFISNSNGQVFMGRKTGKIGIGKYTGPGGKCEVGETPPETAVRETREETEVKLVASDLIKVAEITFHNGPDSEFLVHIFTTTKYQGESQDSEEMVKGQWFNISDLIANPRQVEMMAGDYTFLPLILSDQKIRGWCKYQPGSNQGIVLDCHYDIVSSFSD